MLNSTAVGAPRAARAPILQTTPVLLAMWMVVALGGVAGPACEPRITSGHFQCDPGDPATCPPDQFCQQRGQTGRYLCYDEHSTEFCGNARLEADEACDGSDLGGQTCSGLGWWTGTLGCDQSCRLVEDDCRAMVSIAAGTRTTVGVDDRGELWYWGVEMSSHIGYMQPFTHRPTRIEAAVPLSNPTLGLNHGCALGPESGLWCFGASIYGELGNGDVGTGNPSRARIDDPVVDWGTGSRFTCALTVFGEIYCFGYAAAGQCGVGGTPTELTIPAKVIGNLEFVSVGVGSFHACGIDSDGAAWCWGAASDGRLGNGEYFGGTMPEPLAVAGGHTFVDISGGHRFGCALDDQGRAWCWGRNRYGELGDGTDANSPGPVAVAGAGDRRYDQIRSSRMHTCARDDSGYWCWGWMIVDGELTAVREPRLVASSDEGLDRLSPGYLTNCALDTGGKPHCQGYNGVGMLGVDPWITPLRPIHGLPEVTRLELTDSHSCASDAQGALWCAGEGLKTGVFGTNANTLGILPVLTKQPDAPAFQEFCLMESAGCGLDDEGHAWCWGLSHNGAHGQTEETLYTPTLLPGDGQFVALGCGSDHACAVNAVGQTWCWGDNAKGQLGDLTSQDSRTPVAVQTPVAFEALALGQLHSCGLDADGLAWCWGYNASGQLGRGDRVDSATPVAVDTEARFVSLVSGDIHVCGLDGDGHAWCWGDNYSGKLGVGGGSVYRTVPTEVYGSIRYKQLSASGVTTCALDLQGAVYCWGANTHTAFDLLPLVAWVAPVPIPVGGPFEQITTGNYGHCVVDAAGRPLCWGADLQGYLGTLAHEPDFVPVAEPAEFAP